MPPTTTAPGDDRGQRRRRRNHRARLTTPIVAPTRRRPSPVERQLLTPLRRDHRPPARLGALDVRLLVGHRRRPALGLQAVVGDEPRLLRVAAQARAGSGPAGSASAAAATIAATRSGRRMRGRAPVSARTRSPATQPSGATLNTPSRRRSTASTTADARSSRCRNCAGGSSAPSRWPKPGGERGGERRRAVGRHRHDGAQHASPCAAGRRGASGRPSPRRSPAGGRTRTRRRGAGWRPRSAGSGCWRRRRTRAPTTRARCASPRRPWRRAASRRRRR